jgi:23S rRNA (guanosine2251-2'-O)-methyltransferase
MPASVNDRIAANHHYLMRTRVFPHEVFIKSIILKSIMSEIIYGIHSVKALLDNDPQRFLEVFILKGRDDKRLKPLVEELEASGIVIQVASRQWLDDKSEGAVHQGIVARVKEGRQYQENDLPALLESLESPFLLVLDGVTDPHNLGACLRTADAAGVHAVIVPRDRSAKLNATAKKVASGAAENVPLINVTNLARTLRVLQEHNVWIVGTAGEADHTLFQSKMTGPMALVMGAEGEGMRRLTREHCDELISIPMAGSVSSLNVSVATGVGLFEAVRQRAVKAKG